MGILKASEMIKIYFSFIALECRKWTCDTLKTLFMTSNKSESTQNVCKEQTIQNVFEENFY